MNRRTCNEPPDDPADMTDEELSAALAGEVMGEDYVVRNGVATKTDGFRSILWSPPTDIAAAMGDLLNEMERRGYDLVVSCLVGGSSTWSSRSPARTHASWLNYDADGLRHQRGAAWADTPSRAISEAALMAVREAE